jgi:hypothetical protein
VTRSIAPTKAWTPGERVLRTLNTISQLSTNWMMMIQVQMLSR